MTDNDEDRYDETDTTAEEFDAMWEVSEPVETLVPITVTVSNLVVTFSAGSVAVLAQKPATSGSFDEDEAPAPESTRHTFDPRQPVLLPSA